MPNVQMRFIGVADYLKKPAGIASVGMRKLPSERLASRGVKRIPSACSAVKKEKNLIAENAEKRTTGLVYVRVIVQEVRRNLYILGLNLRGLLTICRDDGVGRHRRSLLLLAGENRWRKVGLKLAEPGTR